jgi:hypothetical protein
MFCQRCKYPLHGLGEPRCPECGRAFDPVRSSTFLVSTDQWSTRQQIRAGVLMLGFLAIAVLIILAMVLGLGHIVGGALPI